MNVFLTLMSEYQSIFHHIRTFVARFNYTCSTKHIETLSEARSTLTSNNSLRAFARLDFMRRICFSRRGIFQSEVFLFLCCTFWNGSVQSKGSALFRGTFCVFSAASTAAGVASSYARALLAGACRRLAHGEQFCEAEAPLFVVLVWSC